MQVGFLTRNSGMAPLLLTYRCRLPMTMNGGTAERLKNNWQLGNIKIVYDSANICIYNNSIEREDI